MTEPSVRWIRSKRKSVSLEVKPDHTIVIRTPYWMMRKDVDRFLDQKASWIRQAIQRIDERQKNHPELTPGEAADFRDLAKKVIPEKVKHYSPLSNSV